jgi:hypothetical protein
VHDEGIVLEPDPAEVAALLERRIIEHNYAVTGICDGAPFAFSIRDGGDIVAGLRLHLGAGVRSGRLVGR